MFQTRAAPNAAQAPWSALQPIHDRKPQQIQGIAPADNHHNRKNPAELVKSG